MDQNTRNIATNTVPDAHTAGADRPSVTEQADAMVDDVLAELVHRHRAARRAADTTRSHASSSDIASSMERRIAVHDRQISRLMQYAAERGAEVDKAGLAQFTAEARVQLGRLRGDKAMASAADTAEEKLLEAYREADSQPGLPRALRRIMADFRDWARP